MSILSTGQRSWLAWRYYRIGQQSSNVTLVARIVALPRILAAAGWIANEIELTSRILIHTVPNSRCVFAHGLAGSPTVS